MKAMSIIKWACVFLALIAPASAETISFQGKTITAIIGAAAGGGTDVVGRLFATFLAKHLPGSPAVVVQNIPGADGVIALNYFLQQVRPDGLTFAITGETTVDPLKIRQKQVLYDPTKFPVIGGGGRGGDVIVISNEAEKRLYDKSLPPAVMGATVGVPRNGMQATAWGIEYLGWNAKWVRGYNGTNELIVALERGEIDMTGTGDLFKIKELLASGKFKILTQSGVVKNGEFGGRPEFGSTPNLAELVQGKITDPAAREAFRYYNDIEAMDKWVALPPETSIRFSKPIAAHSRKLWLIRSF